MYIEENNKLYWLELRNLDKKLIAVKEITSGIWRYT